MLHQLVLRHVHLVQQLEHHQLLEIIVQIAVIFIQLSQIL